MSKSKNFVIEATQERATHTKTSYFYFSNLTKLKKFLVKKGEAKKRINNKINARNLYKPTRRGEMV